MAAYRRLFPEAEDDGGDEAEEGGEVVPVDGFALEDEGDDEGEDRQGDDLLNDFELHQGVGAAVDGGAHPVGRNHKDIFEKGQAPGGENDENQRPVPADIHLRKLELSVPGERHENVRDDEQQDGP